MSQTPEQKVQLACTRISIRYPFFATFLVRMNVERNDSITTMCTNGRRIQYAGKFVDDCSLDEVVGTLIHEVLHIVCKHHLRMHKRNARKWNKAIDYVIDPMVLEQGFRLPKGPGFSQHHDTRYANRYAEWVYDRLPDEPEGGGWGTGLGDVEPMTNEDGSDMSPSEAQMEEANVDTMITIAAKAQKDIGKLPGHLQEIITQARESRVPFEDILERFVGGEQPDGHDFSRPARHQFYQMRLMMPSVQKKSVGHVVIAIDTSGSMSTAELQCGFSEIKHLMEEFGPESVTIIYADSRIQKIETFDRGEEIDRLNIKGRGGTAVRPAINHAINNMDRVDRFIYITDMEFSDAGEPPEFPVLWLNTHTSRRPPYGEIAHIPVGGRQ